MSKTTTRQDPSDQGVRRLHDLTRLFDSVMCAAREAVALLCEDPRMSSQLTKTIMDIDRLDAELIKAERNVRERHGDLNEPDALDLNHLRADIGRILDRIRTTQGAGDLSEGAVGTTTGGTAP